MGDKIYLQVNMNNKVFDYVHGGIGEIEETGSSTPIDLSRPFLLSL
jgi:hypothetical protein